MAKIIGKNNCSWSSGPFLILEFISRQNHVFEIDIKTQNKGPKNSNQNVNVKIGVYFDPYFEFAINFKIA